MPYDIFMLAYGEPNAAENWARLRTVAPKHLPAPRLVENVTGLLPAHAACARRAATRWFFLVDADNWIHDGFDFAVPFAPGEREITVWGATNPFNALCYGHGGIKLLPAALLLGAEADAAADALDLTVTLAPNRFVDLRASEHRFNTSPYGTWAGVFRECVKHAFASGRGGFKQRAVARHRLEQWQRPDPAAPFAEWCRIGAGDGIAYAREFAGQPAELRKINDFRWLRAAFARRQQVIEAAR